MVKKIISLSLVASIFTQSVVVAGGIDDLMTNSNFMNVTPGGTYTTGDGGKALTTSSVYFRFGPSIDTFEPIIQTSSPSIGANCSGFNLKGMFVQILGLDRIAKMLKSAGASFAWGIVIGLIYSLPGVASAFNMINAWAKKIMELLKNSCNAGKKLASNALAANPDFNMKDSLETWDGWMNKLEPDEKLEVSENGSLPKLASGVNSLLSLYQADVNPDDPSNPSKDEILKSLSNSIISSVASAKSPFSEELKRILSSSIAVGSGSDFINKILSKNNNLNLSSLSSDLVGNAESTGLSSNIYITYNSLSGPYSQITLDELLRNSNLSDSNKLKSIIQMVGALSISSESKSVNLSEIIAAKEKIKKTLESTNPNASATNDLPFKAFDAYGAVQTTTIIYEKSPLNIGEEFGKYLSYKYLGLPSDGNGNVIDRSNFEYEFKLLESVVTLPITVSVGPIDSKGTSKMVLAIGNTNGSAELPFFGENLWETLPTTTLSLEDRFKRYIDLLAGTGVDEPLSPAQASAHSDVGLPALINFPDDMLHIYRQTGEGDKSQLREGLSHYALCKYIDGFKNSFPTKMAIGSPSNIDIFHSDGNTIEPSSGQVTLNNSDDYISHGDIEDFTKGLEKGIKERVTSISSLKECKMSNLEDLRASFRKQDIINKSINAKNMNK